MDILRKELGGIYEAQQLGLERLPACDVAEVRRMADTIVKAVSYTHLRAHET